MKIFFYINKNRLKKKRSYFEIKEKQIKIIFLFSKKALYDFFALHYNINK
jgi:hypothetical protein